MTGLQKIPLFQVIDPTDMLDPDLCTPFNVVAVPANSNEHDEDVLGGASGTEFLRYFSFNEKYKNGRLTFLINTFSKKVPKF